MRPISKPFSVGLLSLLLCLGTGLSAQQKWTLEDCIRYAQEQNISIKRQELQTQSANSNLSTAKASRLPQINGWVAHNLSSGKTVNFEDYSYINTEYQDGNMGLQGSVPLFSGLGIMNTVKQQKFMMQAAVSETETLKNSIAVQVTSAFLQVVFAEELLVIAKEQLSVSQQQVNSTGVFVEQGKMAKANLLEMKAQEAQDALAVVQAENQLNDALLQLAHLMNLMDNTNFAISHPDFLVLSQDQLSEPDQVYFTAVKDLPRIKGAEYRLKASEAGFATAKSQLSPSISLNGMFYSRYSELGVDPLNPSAAYPYKNQLIDNSYGRVSINMDIPIFNQLKTKNQISQAKINTLDAKLALDQAKNSLKQEIQTAYSNARNALAKYQASQTAVESTAESHSFVEERYKSGLASSIDFNISKNSLVKTKSNLLQAKYEYLLLSKILDFYQGKEIGF